VPRKRCRALLLALPAAALPLLSMEAPSTTSTWEQCGPRDRCVPLGTRLCFASSPAPTWMTGVHRSFSSKPCRSTLVCARSRSEEMTVNDDGDAFSDDAIFSSRWTPEEPLVRSIERLGGKVTKSDVLRAGADSAGLERELLQLARASGAPLRVSSSGEILFDFPADLRTELQRKSRNFRLRRRLSILSKWSARGGRVLFGVSLYAVIALIFLSLAAASSSRDNRQGGSSASYHFNLSAFDYYYLWNLDSRRMGSQSRRQGAQMPFLESVFSFVFGDPNPNRRLLEETRWACIARRIAEHGGAVLAEQLAPYLDPPDLEYIPKAGSDEEQRWLSEAMLPVLLRFGGTPKVTDDGSIVYVFPELQGIEAASREMSSRDLPQSLQEKPLKFSSASKSQEAEIWTMGAFAVVLVLCLGARLASPQVTQAMEFNPGLANAARLYPWLRAYCLAFVGLPLLRKFRLKKQNRRLQARNTWRQSFAKRLRRNDRSLLERLKEASGWSRLWKRFSESPEDVAYDSSKAVSDFENQAASQNAALSDFDRRLTKS